MNINCKRCKRTIELVDGTWVDPEATGDDSIWRETCEANHEDRVAAHEPDSDQQLDVWLRIPDGSEESEAEANTFYEDGGFVVKWYLTAVGLVTRKTFTTYEAAQVWLKAEGFEDYSS
jgi:hypothetical protein